VNGENTTTTFVIRVQDLVATLSLTITNPVTRTVQATATLSAINVTIARYDWTFAPDASQAALTTTLGNATVNFAGPGTKDVSVKITLVDGRSATATAQIQVP